MFNKYKKGFVCFLFVLLMSPSALLASSVRHLNLDALTERAGLIFRGTVTTVKPGTVNIGGAELPTTTYGFRVSELFKGEATLNKDGEQYIAVTIIGSVKESQQDSGIAKLDRFRDIPRLQQGAEMLLFTTAQSDYGLSVTVGLAQGCFDIDGSMALNRAGNIGLFREMSYAGPASGPIAYNELAARIRASLGTR